MHRILPIRCSYIYGKGGALEKFTKEMQDKLVVDVIEPMACDGLRTISVAYKDFVPSNPAENEVLCSVDKTLSVLLAYWPLRGNP